MKMNRMLAPLSLSLFPIIGGILLIAFPAKAVTVAFLILSLYLIWSGGKNLWFAFRFRELPVRIRRVALIKNLATLIIGAIIFIKGISSPESMMSFGVYIVAAYLLASAFVDMFDSRAYRSIGLPGTGTDGMLNLLFAVILFFFPRFIGSTFMRILGAVILLIGCVILWLTIISWKNQREMDTHMDAKTADIEAEWEDKN